MIKTLKYKNFIPQDSRYVPLNQQKWLCVPTCIQMIMLRHSIPLIPAELMAPYLRTLVPRKDAHLFYKPITGPKPKAGWGTQVRERDAANKMFKETKIPLQMRWHLVDEFKNLKEFKRYLSGIEKKNLDVAACFSYGKLYDASYQGGHLSLADKVYVSRNKVRLVDPDIDSPKWRIVSIPKLYRAMLFHGGKNSAGFWEFIYRGRKK